MIKFNKENLDFSTIATLPAFYTICCIEAGIEPPLKNEGIHPEAFIVPMDIIHKIATMLIAECTSKKKDIPEFIIIREVLAIVQSYGPHLNEEDENASYIQVDEETYKSEWL